MTLNWCRQNLSIQKADPDSIRICFFIINKLYFRWLRPPYAAAHKYTAQRTPRGSCRDNPTTTASSPLAFFIMPFTSWIAFPMLMILMPIPTAWVSGGWLMRYKRNKPDHYLWQRVSLLRARLLSPGEHGSLATGSYRFITLSRAWELKRTRRKGLI